MRHILFSGLLELPWWGYVLVALALTHVTIVGVTVFLHRHQAHRALDLHPAVSHFFRAWLWLTTGMVTREWAAVHRKHHAKCDGAEDPHSPQIAGINRVLWGGVFLYVKAARSAETLERYGHGTPDDWLERNVYSRHTKFGIVLMGLIDLAVFGVVPGAIILAVQLAWIPFWAAGVINGLGHYWGYRNWPTPDWSTNISPWGILIGGEELHNNHHAYPTSAKLSNKWFEVDIGWGYIRTLRALGLAHVKHVAPVPRFIDAKPTADVQTLQAVIANRYDVLAQYAKTLLRAYADEVRELRRAAPDSAGAVRQLRRWLRRDETTLAAPERAALAAALAAALPRSQTLATMWSMRGELAALWRRSSASREQLLEQLQDWCRRAESSGVRSLALFSQSLRRYA